MISSNLVVEGVPGNHHLHHHALAGAGNHPIHSFSAIHHLNPNTVATSRAHLMSATSFAEPSFLKTPNGSLLPPAEFLRPLPKPAPVVATRYNGVTSSLNGSIKSRLSGKYADADPQGPVNLVHQLKDSSASDVHASYGLYSTARLYQPGPSYPPHFPPPPSIQSGPYGPLYPSSPFTPMLQRENRSTHLLQLQQYPDSNTPILKSPPTSIGSVVANSVKTIYEPPVVPIVTSEPSNRGEKRPFKVPSGKEGSMKHRILTRPETRVQKKCARGIGALLPPPVPVSSTSNGNATSPTESSAPAAITSNNTNGHNSTMLHNFSKGSLIRLANGHLKKVEDMQTEDFLSSAEKSSTVRIDPSTVVRIQENPTNKEVATLKLSYGEQRHEVDFETALEHPYFVFEHGWSSCSPSKTLLKYGLRCRQLQVGDVCVSLSPRLSHSVAARKSSSQKADNDVRKSCQPLQQHQQHQQLQPQQHQQPPQSALQLQNGHLQQHLTSNVDAKVYAYKKNDLRINSNDSDELHCSNGGHCNGNTASSTDSSNIINSCNFSINIMNRRDEAKKLEKNDSNNNNNDTSDKYDGLSSKKKRRWSAPDQITEEYQSSPLSSPLSSSSVLSSASSVCSAVISTKNM